VSVFVNVRESFACIGYVSVREQVAPLPNFLLLQLEILFNKHMKARKTMEV